MTIAVDTNVLIDAFKSNAPYHRQSQEWLRVAYEAGPILVCDLVYAEMVPFFGNQTDLDGALRSINATLSPIDSSIAYEAGLRWMRYRRAGGPRERIIADFLIGAHALAEADSLLTRNRGFYGTYFPELARP